ncbi:hypothetical protein PO909_025449 [Leuciscus waleckii]
MAFSRSEFLTEQTSQNRTQQNEHPYCSSCDSSGETGTPEGVGFAVSAGLGDWRILTPPEPACSDHLTLPPSSSQDLALLNPTGQLGLLHQSVSTESAPVVPETVPATPESVPEDPAVIAKQATPEHSPESTTFHEPAQAPEQLISDVVNKNASRVCSCQSRASRVCLCQSRASQVCCCQSRASRVCSCQSGASRACTCQSRASQAQIAMPSEAEEKVGKSNVLLLEAHSPLVQEGAPESVPEPVNAARRASESVPEPVSAAQEGAPKSVSEPVSAAQEGAPESVPEPVSAA